MNFVHPAALWGLFAIGIPILIHILANRRFQNVQFSAVRFLKMIEQDTIRKMKIRHLLLLVLRSLLILFLIFGLSRPVLNTGTVNLTGWDSDDPVFVIMDNSVSMTGKHNGQTLLEHARSTAVTLLEKISYPQMIEIIPSTEPPDVTIPDKYFKTQVFNKIRAVQPSFFPNRFETAIETIGSAIRTGRYPNTLIILFSDLQDLSASDLEDAIEKHLAQSGWTLLIIPSPTRLRNMSISGIQFDSQIIQSGNTLTVGCVVQNQSEDQNSLPVQIYLDDVRSGQVARSIPAGETIVQSFEINNTSRNIAGYFEIPDDAIDHDNRRYFCIPVPQQINILILSRAFEMNYYIDHMLDQFSETLFNSSHQLISQLPMEDMSRYDLVIINDVDILTGENLQIITDYLKSNGKVILFPGPYSDVEKYNNTWTTRLGFPRWKNTFRDSTGFGFFLIGEWNRSHPIFRGMWLKSIQSFDSPEFTTIPLLVPGDHEIVAGFSNGYPFILESRDHNSIIFATDLVSAWGDLPQRGIFAPLLLRTILYLSSESVLQNQQISYSFGDHIQIRLGTASISNETVLVTPDHREILVNPSPDQAVTIHQLLTVPGLYTLKTGESGIPFAVNIPAEETRKNDDEIDRIINKFPDRVIRIGETDTEIQASLQYGKELWPYCIGLVLLLMLCELYVARGTKSKVR